MKWNGSTSFGIRLAFAHATPVNGQNFVLHHRGLRQRFPAGFRGCVPEGAQMSEACLGERRRGGAGWGWREGRRAGCEREGRGRRAAPSLTRSPPPAFRAKRWPGVKAGDQRLQAACHWTTLALDSEWLIWDLGIRGEGVYALEGLGVQVSEGQLTGLSSIMIDKLEFAQIA